MVSITSNCFGGFLLQVKPLQMDSSATLHELRTVPLPETQQKSLEQQCQQVRSFSSGIQAV